ncbi:MAG: esterase family protein [Acidobacteria bacterium]|nr:esterase family protein [Acidobacteriota bacterium]
MTYVLPAFAATFLLFYLSCFSPLLAASPTTVECGSVPSSILRRSVGYCIDLPADYSATTPRRYPTLYFLHGLFGNDHRWVDRGGKEIFDELTAKGRIGHFLVVMPDGGETFYINSEDGRVRYEDFFIQEFVPYIDQHYRTIAKRDARGISGLSMGGYGALHLAMLHADIFGSVSAHSAVLLPKFPNPIPTEGRWGFYARILQHAFGSPLNQAYWEENSPLTLAKHPERFQGLKIYFDCGDHDRYGFEKGAALLDEILNKENYPHEYVLRPGGHGWSFLDKYMKYSLLFEWRIFRKAEQDSTLSTEAGSH